MEKLYKLRFRHLDGDVGPLQFQEATTVLGMKNSIYEEWPTEGELSTKVRAPDPCFSSYHGSAAPPWLCNAPQAAPLSCSCTSHATLAP
jgi:Ubiquitin-2 like Rad60 SUMO-like